jgi:hypothetical protein
LEEFFKELEKYPKVRDKNFKKEYEATSNYMVGPLLRSLIVER